MNKEQLLLEIAELAKDIYHLGRGIESDDHGPNGSSLAERMRYSHLMKTLFEKVEELKR